MSILNDGIYVFLRLSRDFESVLNSNIEDEPAFKVLLEEFPDLFRVLAMTSKHWRDPNRSIKLILRLEVDLFKLVYKHLKTLSFNFLRKL